MKKKLREEIKKKYDTYDKCAETVGMDKDRFYNLIFGRSKWERTEILKIRNLLGITQENLLEYFEPSDINFVKYWAVREKILEQFESVSNYCKISGYQVYYFNKKLKGEYNWVWRDVVQFCKIFGIPVTNAEFYFGDSFANVTLDIHYAIKQLYGSIKCLTDEIDCNYSTLWKFLNDDGFISEDIAYRLCEALEIDIKQFLKIQDVAPAICEVGFIDKSNFEELQEILGLTYSGLWSRLKRRRCWETAELEELSDFLNINDLSDFIDESGYTKMVIINKYRLK